MRIAFYAPMKALDHPVPSGDRTMARALVAALRHAGHDVEPQSALRSFLPCPDPETQAGVADLAAREGARIEEGWVKSGPPDLWFTYHNHYKAPDLIGPGLARRANLPYAIAEASHAPRRAVGWTTWHAAAEAASRAADLHLCLTARDRLGLEPILTVGQQRIDLPPFIDRMPPAPARVRRADAPLRMVTLAMMRPGDKLASYTLLAQALSQVTDLDWHLDVIGGGPAQAETLACFSDLAKARVAWHGTLDREAAWSEVARADLFVWPGIGEAFGLAFLEAQAAGVPVLALNTAGVPAVVVHGRTGILVDDVSASAFAAALRGLASDRTALRRMGDDARRFVQDDRTLDHAAPRLDKALRRCRNRKLGHD